MDREQTKYLLAVIYVAYPNYYRGAKPQDMSDVVKLWTKMFEEDPMELVMGAVKAFIASDEKGFPPVIGQIKAKIRDIRTPKQLPETAAWAVMQKALKNSGYHPALCAP